MRKKNYGAHLEEIINFQFIIGFILLRHILEDWFEKSF